MKLLAVVYTKQKRPSALSEDEQRALAVVACVKLIRPLPAEEAA